MQAVYSKALCFTLHHIISTLLVIQYLIKVPSLRRTILASTVIWINHLIQCEMVSLLDSICFWNILAWSHCITEESMPGFIVLLKCLKHPCTDSLHHCKLHSRSIFASVLSIWVITSCYFSIACLGDTLQTTVFGNRLNDLYCICVLTYVLLIKTIKLSIFCWFILISHTYSDYLKPYSGVPRILQMCMHIQFCVCTLMD